MHTSVDIHKESKVNRRVLVWLGRHCLHVRDVHSDLCPTCTTLQPMWCTHCVHRRRQCLRSLYLAGFQSLAACHMGCNDTRHSVSIMFWFIT